MTTYKLFKDPISNEVVSVFKNQEGSPTWSVPFDPANTDYQEYLAWLSSGNVPLPPDEMGGDTSTTATTE
jgi:hypothetical protein